MKAGFVALVGRPNGGESRCLNHLVGQKLAIVSDKPRPTRNRIVGVKNVKPSSPQALEPTEGQIVFSSTPPVSTSRCIASTYASWIRQSIFRRSRPLIAVVIDASEASGGGDRFLLDLVGVLQTPRSWC